LFYIELFNNRYNMSFSIIKNIWLWFYQRFFLPNQKKKDYLIWQILWSICNDQNIWREMCWVQGQIDKYLILFMTNILCYFKVHQHIFYYLYQLTNFVKLESKDVLFICFIIIQHDHLVFDYSELNKIHKKYTLLYLFP